MGALIIPFIMFIPTVVGIPLCVYWFWHHNLVALAVTVIAGTLVQVVWWKLFAAFLEQIFHFQ